MIYSLPIVKAEMTYADDGSIASVGVTFIDGSFAIYTDREDITEAFDRMAAQQAEQEGKLHG